MDGDSNQLVVMPSRSAAAKGLVVALLMFGGGIGCAWAVRQVWPRPVALAAQVVLVPCAVLFLVAACYALRFFSKRPVLVVGADGVTDQSGLGGVGFVGWTEIAGVRHGVYGRSGPLLIIDARHPDQIIERQPWRLKRMALRFNDRHGLGIVAIAERLLSTPAQSVAEAITEHLETQSGHPGKRTRRRR